MKVSKRAYDALQASIEHWTRLAACETRAQYTAEGYGGDECKLCKLYARPDRSMFEPCSLACPVRRHSGEWVCGGTPWYAAARAISLYVEGTRKSRPVAQVRAELAYLRMVQRRCRIK